MRSAIIYLFGSLFQLSAVKVSPNDVINVYESLHIQSFLCASTKAAVNEPKKKRVEKSLFFGRNKMVHARACENGQFTWLTAVRR